MLCMAVKGMCQLILGVYVIDMVAGLVKVLLWVWDPAQAFFISL